MCALASMLWSFNASAEVVEYACGATESDNVTVSIDTETGVMTISGTGEMASYSLATLPWVDYKSIVKKGVVEEGVTNVGGCAFMQFTALTEVSLSSTVTSLGLSAFNGCTSLPGVEFTSKLTTIGNYAFSGCTSIIDLTIPNTIKSLGIGSYYQCTGLKKLVIESNLTEIPEKAFADCFALESVNLPDGLLTIGKQAFDRDSKLTSIKLPSTLEKIDDSAFSESGLTSIIIPKSVTSIAGSKGAGSWTAFQECNSLTSIVVEEGNPKYDSRDNCNAIIETETNKLIIGCNSTEIPNTVEVIGAQAFYGLLKLTNITIPSSVTTIEYQAFAYCKKFNGTIDIPKSVTNVANNAFANIGSTGYQPNEFDLRRPIYLKDIPKSCFVSSRIKGTVVLSTQVETIGKDAFYGLNTKTLVSLAEIVPTATQATFTGASSSCTLYYPKGSDYSSWSSYFKTMVEIDLSGECGDGLTWEFDTETYTLKISGSGMMADYTDSNLAPWNIYAKAIETVILADEQTTIDNLAFSDCINLTTIIYEGENALTVDAGAFNTVDENAILFVKEGKLAEYSDVTDVDVKEITLALDITEATIGYAETVTLTPTYSLADFVGDVKYSWDSSDLTVATVTDGKVSPVSPGFTDITASVKTPAGHTIKAVCKVEVVDEATGIEEIKANVSNDDEIYDLLGRKVTNPSKGIYIKNGKKLFLK